MSRVVLLRTLVVVAVDRAREFYELLIEGLGRFLGAGTVLDVPQGLIKSPQFPLQAVERGGRRPKSGERADQHEHRHR